ncbi:hypothetical protein MMA231_03147 [Asticcacaulis sp. MM231]|uniref:hypothetical protein n=1 Tax=Asticcacaulis sp. MM231 TaxID=3157666 RepID=UPI0032D5A9EE
MVASRIALALSVVCLGAGLTGAVQADEVVVAARAKLPTQEQQDKAVAEAKLRAEQAPKPAATQDQVIASLANTQPIKRLDPNDTRYDLPAAVDTRANPRQIHGQVSVSVGTGGYHSAYVSSVIPVGENGLLGIAVSQTDYGNNRVYGYGYDPYGYDDAYGYGYGAPYGNRAMWSRRGGKSQSLAVSLDMNGRNATASTPEGCAPGFRAGDRYIEPLWVSRMNDNRDCETTAEKP